MPEAADNSRRVDALVAEIGSTTTVVSAFDGLVGGAGAGGPRLLGQGVAANSSALTRLLVEATPWPAMSKAVPWSTEVRMIGSPSATFTPPSKSSSLSGMCP